MKVEKHSNGRLELWLTPQDALEQLILKLMTERAQKGQRISLRAQDNTTVISVDE